MEECGLCTSYLISRSVRRRFEIYPQASLGQIAGRKIAGIQRD